MGSYASERVLYLADIKRRRVIQGQDKHHDGVYGDRLRRGKVKEDVHAADADAEQGVMGAAAEDLTNGVGALVEAEIKHVGVAVIAAA